MITRNGNHLYLYGYVGDEDYGFTPTELLDALKEVDGDVTVHINSNGGSVYDGFAAYNILRHYAQTRGSVVTVNDGAAHSAASLILMGGDKVMAAEPSLMLLHLPRVSVLFATLKEDDIEALGKHLEAIREQMVGVYAKRWKGAPEDLGEILAKETVFSPQQALENGLIDHIVTDVQALSDVAPKIAAFVGERQIVTSQATGGENTMDWEKELKAILGVEDADEKALLAKVKEIRAAVDEAIAQKAAAEEQTAKLLQAMGVQSVDEAIQKIQNERVEQLMAQYADRIPDSAKDSLRRLAATNEEAFHEVCKNLPKLPGAAENVVKSLQKPQATIPDGIDPELWNAVVEEHGEEKAREWLGLN